MTKKEIQQFRKRLLVWFNMNQRKLPWRETKDHFYIWVSEVMLQQTQVKKVLEYFNNFIVRFPDVHTLSNADLQEVLKAWEGMGYYARARNLHRAARIIVAEKGGHIPKSYSDFRKLPGVGDYIAAAVLSQAFNALYAVVDGNVKRVLSRLFLINDPVSSSSAKTIFKEHANLLLDKKQPGLFNQAMMELGALICRPKKPNCNDCPISSFCQAYKTNQQMKFPETMQSKNRPKFHIVVGIVHKDGHILITQRKTDGLLGGLWEFPGGRVNNGEISEQACIKKIKEKVDLTIKVDGFFTQVSHAYTHFKITLDVFLCRYQSGRIKLNGPINYRWISVEEIDNFPFHAANHKFIPLLKEKLKEI